MENKLLKELELNIKNKGISKIKIGEIKNVFNSINFENIDVKNTLFNSINFEENDIENIYFKDIDKFIWLIKDDDRKSVQDIIKRALLKKEKFINEQKRLDSLNTYENNARKNGYIYIGGVDEAGRGPLAGPVVASVVVFEGHSRIPKINDSKKLSESTREELFDIIIKSASDYGIGMASPEEIDEHNILNATYIAMKRAVSNLKQKPDYLLNDAVIIPDLDIRQESIIKGDLKSISIAAASILAKVTRDRIMYEYDKKFPEYNFSSNKGYGTNAHYDAIKCHGITNIHRLSFLKNFSEFFDEKNIRK